MSGFGLFEQSIIEFGLWNWIVPAIAFVFLVALLYSRVPTIIRRRQKEPRKPKGGRR